MHTHHFFNEGLNSTRTEYSWSLPLSLPELLQVIKDTDNDDLTEVLQELIETYYDNIADIAVELCSTLVSAIVLNFKVAIQNLITIIKFDMTSCNIIDYFIYFTRPQPLLISLSQVEEKKKMDTKLLLLLVLSLLYSH